LAAWRGNCGNSWCRCWGQQAPVTLPVAASSAANRLAVPCRMEPRLRFPGIPGRGGSTGVLRSSAWVWGFPSAHSTPPCPEGPGTARSRRGPWPPDAAGGEPEALGAPRLLLPLPPCPGHRDVGDARPGGQQPGRPARHPRPLRRRLQPGQHNRRIPGSPRPARPGPSLQPTGPLGAYRFSRKSTAGSDAPVRRTISSVPMPSSASSTILARCASPARIEGERTREVSTSRSRGGTSTLTVNAISHASRNATSSQGTSLTAQ
jgi:hypothetical protein